MVGHFDGLFLLPAVQRRFSKRYPRTTVPHTNTRALLLPQFFVADTLNLFFCSQAICVVLFFSHNKQLFFTTDPHDSLSHLHNTPKRYAFFFSFFAVALNYILASNQLFSYYSNFHSYFPTHTYTFALSRLPFNRTRPAVAARLMIDLLVC